MILTITKYTEKISKFGGVFYYTEFIDLSNKPYYTFLDPRKKNFIRWKKILKVGTSLKGLNLVSGRLVDADSRFKKIGE